MAAKKAEKEGDDVPAAKAATDEDSKDMLGDEDNEDVIF